MDRKLKSVSAVASGFSVFELCAFGRERNSMEMPTKLFGVVEISRLL